MEDPELMEQRKMIARPPPQTNQEKSHSKLTPTGPLILPRIVPKPFVRPVNPGNSVWGSSWSSKVPFATGFKREQNGQHLAFGYHPSLMSIAASETATPKSSEAPGGDTPMGSRAESESKNMWVSESTKQILVGVVALAILLWVAKKWTVK